MQKRKAPKKESPRRVAKVDFGHVKKSAIVDTEARYIELSMNSEDPQEYFNGVWTLPQKLVTFMHKNRLELRIKDSTTKWIIQISATDVVYHGKLNNEKYKVSKEHFKVLKAKSNTVLLSCSTKECDMHYYGLCLQGTIKIVDGRCSYYG